MIIVMGVSGCGKSTVAEGLARATGGEYLDADAFHPPENVAKMAAGIALTDEDRWGWLDRLATEIRQRSGSNHPVFLACSALKEVYRDRLRVAPVRFVYLKGSRAVLEARLGSRQGHFMNPALLNSQLATLEEPATGPGSDAWDFDIDQSPESLIEAIRTTLRL